MEFISYFLYIIIVLAIFFYLPFLMLRSVVRYFSQAFRPTDENKQTTKESSLTTANNQTFYTVKRESYEQIVPVKAVSLNYHYTKRDLIMTPAETRFFKLLCHILDDEYYVFPQVHLSSLLEHKVYGQNWWGAFHHINRKSVDYVICDKQNVRPLLAIELDDWSHSLDKRKERDEEVEKIFEAAKLPLIRFDGNRKYTDYMIMDALANSGSLAI